MFIKATLQYTSKLQNSTKRGNIHMKLIGQRLLGDYLTLGEIIMFKY